MNKEQIQIEIKRMEFEIVETIKKYGSTKVGKWVKQKPQVLTNFKAGHENWSYNKIIKIYSLLKENMGKEI